MSKPNWTNDQHNAIYAKGGTVLVSAAAGSGKTAVLVERVVQLICAEENATSVDRLLVVTFSNAAAAEMKQRVGKSLAEKIAQASDNTYLQKQQALLDSASISTVHSFCLNLIRENFQTLGISPDFSVLDETELELLMEDCAEDSIEAFYGDPHRGEIFQELVELLTSGRDDQRVKETIFKVYNFARSHPFYKNWLDNMLSLYDPALPPEQTIWGESILYHSLQSLEHAERSLRHGIDLILQDEALTKGYLPMFQNDLHQLVQLREACEEKNWDTAVLRARSFTFDRLGSVRGDCPSKEMVREIRDDVRKIVGDISTRYINATGEEFQADIKDLRPKIEVLFDLVKAFGDQLDQVKRQRKTLDFSDLEHLALSLLANPDRTPTAQAIELAQGYDYVLVDEYQDTNEVQDLIFRCISQNEENLFMVGDVKQSIYSFRMAMPELFLQKKEAYHPFSHSVFPAAINLDRNFRSRKEVTDSVNYIFSQIMSRDMGEIDYDESESLKPGAEYQEHPAAAPELMLLNAEEYDGDLGYTELEATEVAKKIQMMLDEGYQVQDRVEGALVFRPLQPSDICILLRTHRGKAQIYIDKLTEQGIPAWAENAGGFLQAREVSAVVSFLQVLDNPLLDVELTASLLSPLFDFSDDDIVELRLRDRTKPLYLLLLAAAEEGDLQCQNATQCITSLRRYAASHSADKLLLELYRQTSILEIVRVMSLGQSRHANLLLLVEYASHYDGMGYKGLSGFVALLRRIEERGGDLAPANILGDSANVVRVMSIHRSKGLEFPVVILADTAKEFNLQDLWQPTLLHSEYGFACMRRDHSTLAQYPTVPMGAIRLELQKTLLSEEMRVLYVALTRAREKLIVVSTVRRRFLQTIGGLMEQLSDNTISPYRVSTARSYSDWILMALLHHPSGEILRNLLETESSTVQIVEDETPWNIQVIVPDGKLDEISSRVIQRTQAPSKALLTHLEGMADYRYPFAVQTQLPTKLAVSDVVLQETEDTYRFRRRPRFLTEGGLTPAEKGTAMHNYMQFANYENSRTQLEDEIARMERDGFLSPIQVENLDIQRLQAFFQSSLADRIFTSPKVLRELRFMAEFGEEELRQVLKEIDEESKIVLQGVADCVFLENDYAVLVDYKTDRISNVHQLAQRYEGQLSLYQKILEESLQMPVKETILYSFHLSDWIDTSR